jgi:putative polyhydroxyalkanoate system protein
MSKIQITRAHRLGIEAARAEAERIAQHVQDKYGASYAWDGDTMHFSRSGVRGEIAITGDSLDLTIWPSLLLTPIRGQIEQRLVAKIDRHLAARQASGDAL